MQKVHEQQEREAGPSTPIPPIFGVVISWNRKSFYQWVHIIIISP